jgi:hypothetical protein
MNTGITLSNPVKTTTTILLSQTGVTSALNIGSPPAGMKWIVKWTLAILNTGTGTGTRYVQINVQRANINIGPSLANTGSTTGTSIMISGTGDVTDNQTATTSVVYQQFPEIYSMDNIFAQVSLISGDYYDYYIMVEQVPA